MAIVQRRYDPSLPLAFAMAAAFATTIEDIFTPDQDPAVPDATG